MDPISNPSTEVSSANSPRKGRGIHWVLIALVLVSLALCGYLLYQAQQLNKQLTEISSALQNSTPPRKTAPTPDPTADLSSQAPASPAGGSAQEDWKTYTDPQKTFNFKFPKDIFSYQHVALMPNSWSTEPVGAPLELSSQGALLSIEKIDSWDQNYYLDILKLELNETKSDDLSKTTKIENIKIDNTNISVFYSTSYEGRGYSAIWSHSNTMYNLSLRTGSAETAIKIKPLYSQILSTFRFTE